MCVRADESKITRNEIKPVFADESILSAQRSPLLGRKIMKGVFALGGKASLSTSSAICQGHGLTSGALPAYPKGLCLAE